MSVLIKVIDRFNKSKENKFGVRTSDVVEAIANNEDALEALVDAIVADEDLVIKISDAIDALPSD
jgi:hypothetical protein